MQKTLFILLLVFSCQAYSQINKCSTDQMVEQELLLNPDKKILLDQLELFTNTFISNVNNRRLLDTNYIIPVVVHVIHDYGDERIETNQVQSAIQAMCDDFNLLNDDFINQDGEFVHSIANNNDTVNIFAPNVNLNSTISWLVEDNASVQKNDTICVISSGEEEIFIVADDIGNLRFCGGIIKLLINSQNTVNSGDIVAKIITTEARGFEDIASNIGIEFRLATKDPDGNCTTGITYNQSEFTYIGGENVKDDTYWDNSMYLNIWTVASVASGAAAYAYYPGSAPTNHEGILCQHDYFGTTGTSSNSNWRRHTMSHEAGHYFNLAHPWGSTNDSGLEENCGSDDSVNDTPNTVGASGCLSWESQQSCGSLDNVANIMDYTNCAYMFTEGQKQRVIAALNSNSGYRNNLWSSDNLELTGTNDEYYFSEPYAECIPIPDFKVEGDAIGALGNSNGFEVSFTDMSYNVPVNDISYEWSFPGASPSFSTAKNPTITYTSSGQHDVTLKVYNEYGEAELVKEKCIIILDQTSAPFMEGFESIDFPFNPEAEIPSWYILDNYPLETNWSVSTSSSYEGDQSLRIRSKSFTARENITRQAIYTPEIDCSQMSHSSSNPFGLFFDIAYAKRLPYNDMNGNSIILDKLTISRKHANQQFMVRATFDVEDLIGTDLTYFNYYSPEPNHWHEKFVNLGSSAGQESVIIKFEFSGKGYLVEDTLIVTNNGGDYFSNNIGGNWLYIDNVRIGNEEDIWARSPDSEVLFDNRIFDIYGREQMNQGYLTPGIYIRNNELLFINN